MTDFQAQGRTCIRSLFLQMMESRPPASSFYRSGRDIGYLLSRLNDVHPPRQLPGARAARPRAKKATFIRRAGGAGGA